MSIKRVTTRAIENSAVTGQKIAGGTITPDKLSSVLANPPITATGSTTPRTLSDRFADTVNVKDFGAVGDGVTDDRVAIQAGIDSLNAAGGGVLHFPAGTYVIGPSGSTLINRGYGLLLKSNVCLMGVSELTTVLKVQDGADIDLINTDRSASQSKITIQNFTLDGNEANQGASPANGFNLWAFRITTLRVENVKSLNPASWGIRIEQCDRVHINDIACIHSAESNSDGVHFVDTDNVTGGSIWIQTAGDDGFIIEATNFDVKNYALSGIYVNALNGLSLPARGILLMGDENVLTDFHTISNVNLTGCVVENASGHGVILTGSSYESVKIDAVVRGECSLAALYLQPGVAGYSGTLKNCSFDILASDLIGSGMSGTEAFGTISDNRLLLTVSNPGNGQVGASIIGNYWTGSISVDYNPNGDKVSLSQGVIINQDYNDLEISCRGSNKNLFLQGTAQNNTIRIGYLREGVTNDLETLSGAINNRFVGGQIQGTITNTGGNTNQFYGTLGAETYGTVALNFATDADGTAAFNHGLNGTPKTVILQLASGAQNFSYNINALSSSQIDVVAFQASTSVALTTGTYTFHYRASI